MITENTDQGAVPSIEGSAIPNVKKRTRLEIFQGKRTKIIGDMLENPDKNGIFPTTECFEKLDKLVASLLRGECIEFGGEMVYKAVNPDTKMDVPSGAYVMMEKKYDNWKQSKS